MVKEPTLVKPRRSRLAQSRIDYIVYGNPKQVSKLVYDYGYEPPKSLTDLSKAVHELINEKGKKVVLDLVKLHPDRDVILSSVKPEQSVSGENQSNKEVAPEKAAQPVPAEVKTTTGEKCATCGNAYSPYDSYCGCNHAYDDSSASLSNVGIAELRKRFVTLTERAEKDPKNKKIAEEATKIWNEIRLRNQPQSEASGLASISLRESVLIFLLAIIAGVIIGYSSRKPKFYGSNN